MDGFSIIFEKRKVIIDLVKFVGTLSFGAIVLISGFLKNFLQFSDQKIHTNGICFFLICQYYFFGCVLHHYGSKYQHSLKRYQEMAPAKRSFRYMVDGDCLSYWRGGIDAFRFDEHHVTPSNA